MRKPKTQLESAPQKALSPGPAWRLPTHAEPLRLLQLSDCHLLARPGQTLMGVDTERSFQEVLTHLKRTPDWPPDLILLTGDLVQEPLPVAYERLSHYLETLQLPWVVLPGNHDDPEMMANILCRNAQHCAKHILTKTWQILGLNSYLPGSTGGHLDAAELELLTHSLAQAQDRPALIALHHPPLPVKSPWMDTMQVDNGQELLTLLERFPNVKGVIFGHVHQVFESNYRSIRLWSVPSTCFQFKPGSETFALDAQAAGWRWLELHACGQIHTRVERLDHLPPGLDFSLSGY